MKIAIFFLFTAMTTTIMAQPPDTLWTRTFGGDGEDYGNSVQQTTDGGYIMAGYTSSFGAGGNDVWLIKTDSLGSQQWARTFGGNGDEAGTCVLEDTMDTGYIIVGSSSSFSPDSTNDIWLIKTDVNGDTMWTRTFGGIHDDNGNSIAQTNDGGYIVVGTTYSYGTGLGDVWLIKTSARGDSEWTRTFGGWGPSEGNSVQPTTDGGYIIVGTTPLISGNHAAWLIKTDSSGDSLWTRTFTGSLGFYGHGVQQTADGGYIIGVHVWLFLAHLDGVLIKTDSLGSHLWDNDELGGSPECVKQTSDGGYITAGTDLRGDARPLASAFVAKTDSLGNSQWGWDIQLQSIGSDVLQTSDGGYIMVGTCICIEPVSSDVWLIRFASDMLSTPQPLVQGNPPRDFSLLPPYPNPFNPTTIISYFLPRSSEIQVDIYNLLGQRVETLFNGRQEGGVHSVRWDASNSASGIYFVQLRSQNLTQTRKMLLLK
jgi:hypothetical protein